MNYFYSPSDGGFYADAIHGDSMPSDVVSITGGERLTLLNGQRDGASIITGEDGRPALQQPAAPSLDEARTSAMRRVNASYQAAVSEILAEYPLAETATFDKQEREARAVVAGGGVDDAPLLHEIATARGVSLETLAAKAVEKADAYTASIGALTGKRQALEDQIAVADTLDQISGLSGEMS